MEEGIGREGEEMGRNIVEGGAEGEGGGGGGGGEKRGKRGGGEKRRLRRKRQKQNNTRNKKIKNIHKQIKQNKIKIKIKIYKQ